MDNCENCGHPVMFGTNYFMVKDAIWAKFCEKHGFKERDIVCMFCFDKLRGRRISEDEFTLCGVNYALYHLYRWPMPRKLKARKYRAPQMVLAQLDVIRAGLDELRKGAHGS